MLRSTNKSLYWIAFMMMSFPLTSAHSQDLTYGDCSPIVKDVGGSVTITCNLHSRIPVYKFEANFSNDGQAQEIMAKFSEFLDKNGNNIFELNITIDGDLRKTCWDVFNNQKCYYERMVYDVSEETSKRELTLYEFSRNGSEYYDGGVQYIVHQSDGAQWVHGSYVINGFFYVKHGQGTFQGWSQADIYEVDKGQLLAQGRHRLPN